MRVVHDPDGEATELASTVDVADSALAQMRGLMFREEIPEDFALVFEFDDPPGWVPEVVTGWRLIHMLFVKRAIDVLWIRDGRVTKVATLEPWTGTGFGKADTVIELPAGAAAGVSMGDRVVVEDG